MLRLRILSALIGIPVGLLIVWKGGLWLALLLAVFAVIGFQEYWATLCHRQITALREVGFPAVAALVLGALYLTGEELLLFTQGLFLFVVVASLAFHIFVEVQGSKVASAAATVLGVTYIGLLFSFMVLVREMQGPDPDASTPFGLRLFLLVWLATWAADTGAYAAGKTLGRHKLCPRVSPGKTVEGAAGGLVAALVVGVLAGRWAEFGVGPSLAVGAMAAVLGLMGDLSKSIIKRDMGVKDFGTLIPGHGGVLDRFDSLLVNMGAAYFLALLWLR